MKIKTDNVALVIKYLMGELDQSEIENFKKRLIGDKELQDELELHRSVNHAIMNDDLNDFKKSVTEIHDETIGSPSEKRIRSIRKVFLIAASVALLVSLGSIWAIYYDSVSDSNLFQKYYQAYEENVFKDNVIIGSPLLLQTKAMNFYKDSDYSSAKPLLERLIAENSNNEEFYMYYGVICLELNLLEEAERNFDIVLKSKNEKFEQQAMWYQALTYLRAEKESVCVKLLSVIIDKNYYKATEAKSLLKDLN